MLLSHLNMSMGCTVNMYAISSLGTLILFDKMKLSHSCDTNFKKAYDL